MLFAKSLQKADSRRRYTIQTTADGWEVREELDSEVVAAKHYQDWHRVERSRRAFMTDMLTLRAEGWTDVD